MDLYCEGTSFQFVCLKIHTYLYIYVCVYMGKGEAGRWEMSLRVYWLQNLGLQKMYHLRGCTLYHFLWKLLLNLNPVVIFKQMVFCPTNIILLQDTLASKPQWKKLITFVYLETQISVYHSWLVCLFSVSFWFCFLVVFFCSSTP